MRESGRWLWLAVGVVLGGAGVALYLSSTRTALAGGCSDRYEDFVMCTGAASISGKTPTDAVWLLDYKAGKLQGTVIDKFQGKIVGWAEVDLVTEFKIPPRQNVHFLMTTGQISSTQSALYVAETSTGQFGVYTIGPRPDGQAGAVINRHDLGTFRQGGN
jgi:hypothetical protein